MALEYLGEFIINLFKSVFLTLIDNPKLIICTFTAIVVYIFVELFYPKFRGFMGKFWVRTELKKLPKNEYVILNDVMIESGGKTHQIDHIVLSKYGIFVIEMKNYYGLITGTDNKSKWCQHFGKNKYYFMNPIYQNYGHVKVLEECLNLNDEYFIPIVCFSNQAKLKINVRSSVVHLDYLVSEIEKYKSNVFDINIWELQKKILKLNITDNSRRKEHVGNIKSKIKIDEEKINNMICPKCGGELVKRNGKYGAFYGCSNYPECKFTKK